MPTSLFGLPCSYYRVVGIAWDWLPFGLSTLDGIDIFFPILSRFICIHQAAYDPPFLRVTPTFLLHAVRVLNIL